MTSIAFPISAYAADGAEGAEQVAQGIEAPAAGDVTSTDAGADVAAGNVVVDSDAVAPANPAATPAAPASAVADTEMAGIDGPSAAPIPDAAVDDASAPAVVDDVRASQPAAQDVVRGFAPMAAATVSSGTGDAGQGTPSEGAAQTYYFAFADAKGNVILGTDGKPLIQSITVVDGVAQGSEVLASVKGAAEIWEVDANGNRLAEGTPFGKMIIAEVAALLTGADDVEPGAPTRVISSLMVVSETTDAAPPAYDDPAPAAPTRSAAVWSTPAAYASPVGASATTVSATSPTTAPTVAEVIDDAANPLASGVPAESNMTHAAWSYWLIVLGILAVAILAVTVILPKRRREQ
jgi:hypothetical protein